MVTGFRALLMVVGIGLFGPTPAAWAAPPQRIVSINLCTDQLAMLFAPPSRLVSVSFLAQEPRSAVMVAQAQAYQINHGQAEEVYLLAPDLVLAGEFTSPTTLSMLARLGLRIETFPAAYSLADVRAGIVRMGQVLGQEAQAEALVARYDAAFAKLPTRPLQPPTAATYGPNGYASGRRSLSGEIIEAAGLHHLAEDLGLPFGGFLPLEALVMANPDLLITEAAKPDGARKAHATNARAHELLTHPVLAALTGGQVALEDRDWICGLPSVLDAVERLALVRQQVEETAP